MLTLGSRALVDYRNQMLSIDAAGIFVFMLSSDISEHRKEFKGKPIHASVSPMDGF